MAARSAARCGWKPVMPALLRHKDRDVSADRRIPWRAIVASVISNADIRKDRGRCPARITRSMTLADSTMRSPRSGSIFDRIV